MRIFQFFFVFLPLTYSTCNGAEIPCEMGHRAGKQTCFISYANSSDSSDVVISSARKESVKIIYISGKISFLPVLVYKKLPKLAEFHAASCSISEIYKENFEQLSLLEELDLSRNQIAKIESDTFEDLVNIREIYLGHNRIKFMNAKLFDGKPGLEYLELYKNVCIDGFAEHSENLVALMSIISAKCAFSEGRHHLFGIKCGVVSFTGGLIVNGVVSKRGQWPFLVALTLNHGRKFFCGGNLISSRHILTAAHCLHDKNWVRPFEPGNLTVLVGRYNLNSVNESDSETRSVSQIFIHPNWSSKTVKYNADIAILVLNQAVTSSNLIRPICITTDPEMSNHFDGTVVGWGKSESEKAHESIPREVSIQAVTDAYCFAKDHLLGAIFSETSYCAGGEGAGPCAGDSGGGFYVNFNGYWTLKGIVSAGSYNNFGGCDVGRFSLFTKLSDFSDWIKEIVEQS